jgi:hypothetical protein
MIAVIKARLSNCTVARGSLTATYVKPFDLLLSLRNLEIGSPTLDDFCNWSLRLP